MSLTDQIRKVLKDAGVPLNFDQIMEQLPDGIDRNTVHALCGQRKKAGEFASSVEEGKVCYAWVRDKQRQPAPPAAAPAPARAPAPTPAAKPRPIPEGKRLATPAAAPSPNLLEALESSRDTAREALDLYVASVADPSIYAGLVRALDASQAALDAFATGGKA